MRRAEREQFFVAVRDCPFSVRAIVMPKDKIYADSQLRKRGDFFYNYAIRSLLKYSFGTIENAKVFVDGEAGRESLRKMVAYLRCECNTKQQSVIKRVKFVPKRECNVLVQLSDMTVGAIARSYKKDKTDSEVYRSLLAPRIDDVWDFGRGG
jgi:hypothetical protein